MVWCKEKEKDDLASAKKAITWCWSSQCRCGVIVCGCCSFVWKENSKEKRKVTEVCMIK